ncbi:MAG TPA: glycosyltransferase [bacterium]|jgi:glycosyltransferase involved in cell wall biosynthesis|nr:glycosyltransferase [bacterium]
MKVALIHDHLAQAGGAEKVLQVLCELFPEAPIYTLLYEPENVDRHFKNRKILTSIIQRLPGGIKHYQWYMPFMPMAVEFFNLSEFDLVISDASAFAKGVLTGTHTLHICYCHTPTRYLWDYSHQYIQELRYNKYFKKIISLILNYVRLWDKAAADRVDYYIANSKTSQQRIAKYYRRTSEVIYPPVELDRFHISEKPGEYFLIGGRLASYKRIDIVIEAFKELGWPLKIFGDGVDLERLQNIANGASHIEFLGRVSEDEKADLYRNCKAFINPQEEDFGITVIEAMASGRPVIAFRKGGATETVVENKSGLFFDLQTPAALIACLRSFKEEDFKASELRQYAQQFSVDRFKEKISLAVTREYERFKNGHEYLD